MNRALAGFIEELRRAGLGISPAERIDASRAVLAVGIESRPSFRAALRSALAKKPADLLIFDATFDRYFASIRGSGGRRSNKESGPGDLGGRSAAPGSGGGPRSAIQPPEVSIASGRRPRPAEPAGRAGRPIDEGSPRSARTSAKSRTARQRIVTADRALSTSLRERSESIGPLRSVPAGGAALPPPRRPFVDHFTGEEERDLARRVPEIIQEIRLRRGRRYSRGTRGRLWVKKMIRESLAQGGVPFTLPTRQRRPRIPRVVVLVDVSHSVARAAGLFLLVAAGLEDRIRRTEIHLFVDRLVEGTDRIRAWSSGRIAAGEGPEPDRRPPSRAPARFRGRGAGRGTPGSGIVPRRGGLSFSSLLASIPGLDVTAASDYGRAFYQAREHLLRSSGRTTVLVVLGDGRTNGRDPLAWAFEEIAERCRAVIWLDPEPRRLWHSGDSEMGAYLPSCDVVCEARDLGGLARGVKEILRCL